MAGMGGIGCDFVHGNVRGLKERVSTWQVPGMDGYGVQLMALGDASFRFTGVRYGSSATIETWLANIEALQGDIISIVDDWDVEHTNLMIHHVGVPQRAAEYHNGGARCELVVEGLVLS